METPTERHYFLRDLHTHISGGQSVSTFRGPLSLASPRSQDQFITHSPSPWTPKAALEWGCEPIRSHPCSEAQSGIRNQNPEALTHSGLISAQEDASQDRHKTRPLAMLGHLHSHTGPRPPHGTHKPSPAVPSPPSSSKITSRGFQNPFTSNKKIHTLYRSLQR